MTIGTSKGGFYDDEMHMAASPYMMAPDATPDNNVRTPNQVDLDKQLDLNDPMGIEVKNKQKDYGNMSSEDFQNLPDKEFISNIDKNPGFFLQEEMQVQPWKKYSDRAKELTQKTYDLYKSGDEDTVYSVQKWEADTLSRGYNDTEEGRRLQKESFDRFGSKLTMTKSAQWEAYMKHLQDLTAADAEDEKHTPKMREQLENLSLFDRVGRPQMDFKEHWKKGLFNDKRSEADTDLPIVQAKYDDIMKSGKSMIITDPPGRGVVQMRSSANDNKKGSMESFVDETGQIRGKAIDRIYSDLDKSWAENAKVMERKASLRQEMGKMRDILENRDWTEIENAKYNKLGREFHGDKWTDMPYNMEE